MRPQRKVYAVTVYEPQSRTQGRFRHLMVIADDPAIAATTAATAIRNEMRQPTLENMLDVAAVTELPDRAVVYDLSGNAYIVSIILSPAGGNVRTH